MTLVPCVVPPQSSDENACRGMSRGIRAIRNPYTAIGRSQRRPEKPLSPNISVVIPAYNADKFIVRALAAPWDRLSHIRWGVESRGGYGATNAVKLPLFVHRGQGGAIAYVRPKYYLFGTCRNVVV